MYQATTPHFTFTLGIDTAEISEMRLTFYQSNTIILTLTEDDVTMQGNNVDVVLTQEQSLLFIPGQMFVQFRVKLTDDTVEASNYVTINVNRSLDTEIFE